MTTNFQQQQHPDWRLGFSKSTPTPQHGQAPPKEPVAVKPSRSFQPRPGH